MLLFYAAMIDDSSDQLRFADIYNGYRKQMLLVAERVLNNHEDAEDAVQAAFLGIARRMKAVPSDNPKKLRAYVLTAAKNAALTMLHQTQKSNLADEAGPCAIPDEDLFQQIVLLQDYDTLLRVMRQLPSPYREVLLMIYVQEQSVKDTAVLLHRREGTVRQQLGRGKKLLVALCQKEGLSFVQEENHAVRAGSAGRSAGGVF